MNQFISVIIPCHNVEDYIEEAIASVMSQTYMDFELILVDNNSTDGTLRIIERAAINSSRIRVLQEHGQGAPRARNLGLSVARGTWIQFLDADDLMLPDKLERQIKLVKDDTPLLVGTPKYLRLDGTSYITKPWEDPFLGVFEGLRQGNTCCNLWNKKYLKLVDGWEEDRAFQQDYDLIFRILKENDQPEYDFEVSTIIRERSKGQITKRDPKGIRITLLELRLEMMRWLKRNRPGLYEFDQFFYQQTFYRFIRYLAELDLDLAESYMKYLPKDFKPRYSKELYIPFWNAMMVQLVGFKKAEELRRVVRSNIKKEDRFELKSKPTWNQKGQLKNK